MQTTTMKRLQLKLYTVLLTGGTAVMWAIGVGCVGLATALIMFLAYTWVGVLLPCLLDIDSLEGRMQFMMGCWLSFNCLFNHYHASVTPPGEPCDEHLPPIEPKETDLKKKHGEMWARFCKTCWKWKPPRAHHCHFCGGCVLKMDHHCPWINNCVGHYNQRYFFNMLLYIWCATAQITTFLSLYWLGKLRPVHPEKLLALEKTVLLELMLCGVLFVMITLFVVWNGYLILTNQTVIEFYGNCQSAADASTAGRSWSPPFDLGWLPNLQQTYGNYPQIWMMLMPSVAPLHMNGHSFRTIFGEEAFVTNPTGVKQRDDYESDSELRLVAV
eukprot:TRINITY_DN3280_c0_g3_i1.p1 TRINITY_DN3280_c0_g3~~TRINITY_DN3280_c0_g3_i1.p1  ORF type:complete len:357 (+),score=55.31 TRINITY_DN3280_c0_g3_i1:90-1073(+)